jgi:hypothetical protein
MCHTVWEDRESFVSDPTLALNGYQAFFDNPDEGLILFTHRVEGCLSTLALKARAFRPLYKGPHEDFLNAGAESCSGHCSDHRNLEGCQARCSMRWVRDVLQLLRAHRTY